MVTRYHLIAPSELDDSLVTAWRKIQHADSRFSTPYFSPEFTRFVGKVRDDVRIIVIENDNHVKGFFPHQRAWTGFGKPVGGPLSDYHGVICTSDAEWSVIALLQAARLSAYAFNHLIEDSKQRFSPYIKFATVSPQMDLSIGYRQYVDGRRSLTDSIASTERLARKCSREIGELTFTLHDRDPQVLDLLFKWKSEQYRQSGITDGFEVSWTRALLSELSRFQTEEFSGVASSLRVGDRIVAVHFGMCSREVMHWWFPAYDRQFSKYRVGLVSLLRLAESVADIGVRVLDFGKGDERYKQELMTGSARIVEGLVELPSPLSAARQLRRIAEDQVARGGSLGAILDIPVRLIRRIERKRRFK